MKREYMALFAVALALFVFTPAFSSSSSGGSGGNYVHPYPTNVMPGDLVFGHSTGIWSAIPGYWTHVGIIGWYDNNIHDWMVIEAYNPVQVTPLKTFMKRYDTVGIARVSTTNAVREAAVQFAYDQLGKGYDYKWYTKHIYGDKYYCSELVWAAYMAVGGPDIDEHPGWNWKYLDGVAPQEIWDDGDTYAVYYNSV